MSKKVELVLPCLPTIEEGRRKGQPLAARVNGMPMNLVPFRTRRDATVLVAPDEGRVFAENGSQFVAGSPVQVITIKGTSAGHILNQFRGV